MWSGTWTFLLSLSALTTLHPVFTQAPGVSQARDSGNFRKEYFPPCPHDAFLSEKKSGLNATATAGVGGILEGSELLLCGCLTLQCSAESVLRKRRRLKGQGLPQTAQAGLPQ